MYAYTCVEMYVCVMMSDTYVVWHTLIELYVFMMTSLDVIRVQLYTCNFMTALYVYVLKHIVYVVYHQLKPLYTFVRIFATGERAGGRSSSSQRSAVLLS